jgi:tetratricopeptide (TPR) repeat protein
MRRIVRLLVIAAVLAAAGYVALQLLRRRRADWPAPEPGWSPPAVEPVLTVEEDEELEQEIADAEAEGMRAPDWEPPVDVAIDETGHVVEPEPPADEAVVEPPAEAAPGEAEEPGGAGQAEELDDEAVRQLFAEAEELERAVAEFEQLEQAFAGTFAGVEEEGEPDFAAMLDEEPAPPLILPIEDEAEPAAEPLPPGEAPAPAEPDIILSRFEELAATPEEPAPAEPLAEPSAAEELARAAADAASEGMAPPPGAPPVDEARDAAGEPVLPAGEPVDEPPLPSSLEEALRELQPEPIPTIPRRSAESYLDEGNVYFNVGQFALAIDRYTQAILLDPELTAAYYNRANAYTRSGEFDKALADYNRALELLPNDADALNNRGMLFLYRGNYAAAIADFDAALALDPGDTTVMVNRGLAYLHAGDAEAALRDFLTAAELDPRDPAAHYGAAQAAGVLENRAEALRHVRDALALDPGYAREAASDPRLAILQGDPEFLRLLREAGRAGS